MITAKFDISGLIDFQKSFPEMNRKAMAQALLVESERLSGVVQKFASTWGAGTWKPPSPLSVALSQKGGLGSFVSKWTSYTVHSDSLEALVGMVTRDDRGDLGPDNLTPSRIAGMVRMLSEGFNFKMTPQRQRNIAVKLARLQDRGKASLSLKPPRLGWHRVVGRPSVEPVVEMEAGNIVRNLAEVYAKNLNIK